MRLFPWGLTWTCSVEDGADLEETKVPIASGEVVLDPTQEGR
jgi:hypothetical protein